MNKSVRVVRLLLLYVLISFYLYLSTVSIYLGASQEDKEAALAFARAAMLDAAAIGGWKAVALPTAMEAAAVALSRKYPEAATEGGEGGAPPGRHVMLLDMGAG